MPNVKSQMKVTTGAFAKEIVVEDTRAVGVEYMAQGQTKTARARGEVILCAGAFNSRQILQLSGIGPADLLKKMAIPVVLDLPGVGENL